MIFVTVGNTKQSFRRLLEAVDNLSGEGIFNMEPVLVQSGNNSDFIPAHCKKVAFLSPDEFRKAIRESSLVICHAGAGSLYHVFESGKVPIVMPRRIQYGEHIEDQFELVKALNKEGRIIPAYEPEDLPKAIKIARKQGESVTHGQPLTMIKMIDNAIMELMDKFQ